MTEQKKSKPVLSKKQRQRVAALGVARDVLASKSFVSSGAVDTQPLIDVARYVVEARDPLEDYHVNDHHVHVSMEDVREAVSCGLRYANIAELELELERRREGP